MAQLLAAAGLIRDAIVLVGRVVESAVCALGSRCSGRMGFRCCSPTCEATVLVAAAGALFVFLLLWNWLVGARQVQQTVAIVVQQQRLLLPVLAMYSRKAPSSGTAGIWVARNVSGSRDRYSRGMVDSSQFHKCNLCVTLPWCSTSASHDICLRRLIKRVHAHSFKLSISIHQTSCYNGLAAFKVANKEITCVLQLDQVNFVIDTSRNASSRSLKACGKDTPQLVHKLQPKTQGKPIRTQQFIVLYIRTPVHK